MPSGLRRLRRSSIELPRVELLGRAVVEHVHHVHDHHVVALVFALDEVAAVGVDQPRARVLEGALVPGGQVLAAERHDFRVNVHHRGGAHGAVGDDLAQRSALAAADDEHVARLGRAQHRRLHEQFVVERLVVGGALDRAVEHQHAAVVVRIADLHVLEGGPAGVLDRRAAIGVEVERVGVLDEHELPEPGLLRSKRLDVEAVRRQRRERIRTRQNRPHGIGLSGHQSVNSNKKCGLRPSTSLRPGNADCGLVRRSLGEGGLSTNEGSRFVILLRSFRCG